MDIDYTIRIDGVFMADGCVSTADGETFGQLMVRAFKSFERDIAKSVYERAKKEEEGEGIGVLDFEKITGYPLSEYLKILNKQGESVSGKDGFKIHVRLKNGGFDEDTQMMEEYINRQDVKDRLKTQLKENIQRWVLNGEGGK